MPHTETVRVRATIPASRGRASYIARTRIKVEVPDTVEEAIKTLGGDDVLEIIGKAVCTKARLKAYEDLVAQETNGAGKREEVEVTLKRAHRLRATG